jgi:hypothetical protein
MGRVNDQLRFGATRRGRRAGGSMKAHAGNRRRRASTGAVGLVALMLGGCATGSTTAPAAPSDPPTAASVVPTPAAPTRVAPTSPPEAILATLDVGGKGWAMTKAGDALWIQVDPVVDAIVRVDVTTGTTLSTAPGAHKVKAGAAGLWALGLDCGVGWRGRIRTFSSPDPESGALPLGHSPVVGPISRSRAGSSTSDRTPRAV